MLGAAHRLVPFLGSPTVGVFNAKKAKKTPPFQYFSLEEPKILGHFNHFNPGCQKWP
jgi:hypothetical protein